MNRYLELLRIETALEGERHRIQEKLRDVRKSKSRVNAVFITGVPEFVSIFMQHLRDHDHTICYRSRTEDINHISYWDNDAYINFIVPSRSDKEGILVIDLQDVEVDRIPEHSGNPLPEYPLIPTLPVYYNDDTFITSSSHNLQEIIEEVKQYAK